MHGVTLAAIEDARTRLAAYLSPTPLEAAHGLGANIWFKLENTHPTHSFKVRGALNALLCLSAEARGRGIVTASSGNHAQGIAYAGNRLGVVSQIVMSRQAAQRKIAGVRRWGGRVLLHGDSYTAAEHEALRLRDAEGRAYVSAYNDAQVVAGQGSIGLEIAQALPDVRRVLVPVGGGGLISGIAVALKAILPRVRIIGVGLKRAPTLYNLFYGTALPDAEDSLADALPGVIETGSITIDLSRRYVDEIVLVDEAAVAAAMRWMIAEGGWLVEGGGAVGVAALLTGVIAINDAPTVVVISGGNVDAAVVRRILMQEQAYE